MALVNKHLPYWAYGAFLFALGLGYVIGHTLPEYNHTIHRQVAADNLTTATIYLFVVYVYWMRVRGHWPSDETDRWFTQVGVAGSFLSWSLHRIFWWKWRNYLDAGDMVMADWWRDTIAIFTSVLQLSIWAFALVMVWPSVQRLLGADRWWLPGLVVPTVWLAWFGLETVI